MKQKSYIKPECKVIQCVDEEPFLGNTLEKPDPNHGGEDNLAKHNDQVWDFDYETTRLENN